MVDKRMKPALAGCQLEYISNINGLGGTTHKNHSAPPLTTALLYIENYLRKGTLYRKCAVGALCAVARKFSRR
jgi:hypothetical protein